MSEDFYFMLVIISAILAGGLLALGGCHECQQTDRAAMKAGLVQKQITPGSGVIGWSKP